MLFSQPFIIKFTMNLYGKNEMKINETKSYNPTRLEYVEACIDAGITWESPKLFYTGKTYILDGKTYGVVEYERV